MRRAACLLALLPLAGCALILGLDDLPGGGSIDAGADAMPDAPPPPPAVLTIDVERYDMGAALVGTASTPAFVTITNVGTTRTGALTPAIGAPFAAAGSCVGAELDPAATCTVELTVTPAAAGALGDLLTVTAYGGGGVEARVAAEAVDPGTLNASPASVDYGLIAVDVGGAQREVRVGNPGAVALSGNMTVRVTGQDANMVAVARNECGGYSLAAVGICVLDVRAVARKPGRVRVIIVVTSPSSGAIVIPVVASGYPTGSMTITGPANINFAATTVGMMTTASTFMITNNGTVDTGPITAEWNLGAHFLVTSNGCSAGLLPSTTCTIEVRGAPTAAGLFYSTLRLQGASTGGAMISANITGNAPELDVAETTFTFPDTQVDPAVGVNATAGGIVRILNRGNAPLMAPMVSVAGGQFTATLVTCPMIAARSTCNVNLTFKPITAVAHSAILMVTGAGQTKTIALSGTGIADSGLRFTGTPIYAVSDIANNTTTAWTLTNQTGADATVLTPEFASMTEFDYVSDTCPDPLPNAMTCTFSVRFHPTKPGILTGLMKVTSNEGDVAYLPLVGTGRGSFSFSVTGSLTVFPPSTGGAVCNQPTCAGQSLFERWDLAHNFDNTTMPTQAYGTGICEGYGRTGCSTVYPHTGVSAPQTGPATITAAVTPPTGALGRLEGPSSGILCPPYCSAQMRSGQPQRVLAIPTTGMVSALTCPAAPASNVCDPTTTPTATFVDAWVDRHAGLDGGSDEANAVFIKANNVIYATGSEQDAANGQDVLFLEYSAVGVKSQNFSANYLADDRGQDLVVRSDGVIYIAGEQGVGTPSASPILVSWTIPSTLVTVSSGATPSFGLARVALTTQNSVIAIAPTSAGTDTVLRRWDMANALTSSALDPRRWAAITPNRTTDHSYVVGTFGGDIVLGKLNNTVTFDWAQTRAHPGEETAIDIGTFPTGGNLLLVTNETVAGRGTNVRLVEWAADGSAEIATTTFDSGPDSDDAAIAGFIDAAGQIHVLGTSGGVIWVRRWSRQLEPNRVRFLTGTNLTVRDLSVDALGNVVIVGSEEVTGQRDAMVRKIGP